MRESSPLHPLRALRARAILAAALAAAFLAVASPATAATWVVNTTADLDTSQCPAICSVRNAVNQSASGDTVMIPAGHYVLTLPPPEGAINIDHTLTFVGDDARTTVIDANGRAGIFTIEVDPGGGAIFSNMSLVNSVGQSAILDLNGNLALTGMTIANNQAGIGAGNAGGGVNANAGFFSVDSCTFSNNSAPEGGGIFVQNTGLAQIINSTFVGNDAGSGSAIKILNAGGIGFGLGNNTLTANTSSPALAVDTARLFVDDNIIAGNPGGGCSFASLLFFESTNDLDGDGSCGFTDPGSLTGVDPHLGPLANNGGPTDTAALLAGSPAIDAGADGSCFPVDQRGVTRPQGPHCDMGAYEALPTPPNCAGASASPNLLWPPNGKLVPIHINGVTNPSGGAVTLTVTSIFQDEQTSGAPDGTGVGTGNPSVRAQRDGGGDGRVYHISFTATNSAGGSCTGTVTVGVPHDQGKHSTPIDGGALYDSTQP